ncbi:hypothetical protein Tco_0360425, partial [Tanacetum coccineum]
TLLFKLEAFSIVTMLGQSMIDESTSEDVNIFEEDWSLGQCKKQTMWLSSSKKQNMLAACKLLCSEVVTALAAEEEHSTSPHSRAASSARDAQGTPDQSAAQASISQGTAAVQGNEASQGSKEAQEANSFSSQTDLQAKGQTPETVQIRPASVPNLTAFWDKGILSEEHKVQEEDLAHPFFDDTADQDAAVTPDLERKSDETEEVNIEEKEASNVKSGETEELDLETTQSTARQGTITPRILNFEEEAGPSSPLRPIQVMDSEEQHNAAEVLVSISRPRGLSIPGPIQTQPQQPTQGTDPKDKGKGILVEEPKKKKLTLQQIRALETTNDEEVARKIQAEWDAEEERKRFEELKKTKPKTTLRKPTSLAQERNQMMSFLKGQGYKNLQKLKYPQMKELYDKVQASIKDSFKDFIPMDSEKEREMLKEREAKRLLRKRKATISEEQPSKKPKLRTETIDELRNYLRVVDFEKSVHDKESLEGISMITELQVIDSPDGEYLIIHRENNHFRAFDTLWEILHVLDRQDLYHLYRVVDDYYEHIPPTGLGLMLLGDLNIIWETAESSDDDFWKDQEEWEIIRWRFHESSGVHTLEIEDGTMIHMLAERRYPLSRELMIRMLEHGMEVEDESETAITLIHLFILWTTANGDLQVRQIQKEYRSFILKEALGITLRNEANQFVPPIPTLESYLISNQSVPHGQNLREEFIHAIDSFITDKKKLSVPVTDKKKEPKTLLILYVYITNLIIFYLRSLYPFHLRTRSALHTPDEDCKLGNLKFVAKGVDYEIFRMPIPDALITHNIRNAPNYSDYLELVANHDRRALAEAAKPPTPKAKAAKVTKPKATKQPAPKASKPKTTSSQPPKPKPAPTKPSKAPPEKKRKLVNQTPDEPSPVKRSKGGLVGKRRKPKSLLKLVDKFADEGVPISEPKIDDEEADFQRGIELSLKDLEGKGKEKIIDEQIAHTLLDLNTLKKKSIADQYILQKHTPKTFEPTGPSLQPGDEGIIMTNSETETDEIVTPVNKEKDASKRELTEINTGVQDEGRAGSNLGKQDEGDIRSS